MAAYSFTKTRSPVLGICILTLTTLYKKSFNLNVLAVHTTLVSGVPLAERTVHDDRSKGCHGVGLRMTRRSVFFIKFYLIGMDSDLSSSIAKRNSSSRCSGVKGSRVGIGGFDCKPDSVDASGAEVAADSLNGPPLSGSTNRVRVFTLWSARRLLYQRM
jgi:hypothetical protein